MPYPPEFLQLVDKFIHDTNELAERGNDGEVSAAILCAARRYNAFNSLSRNGHVEDRDSAVEFLCLGVPRGTCLRSGESCGTSGQVAGLMNYWLKRMMGTVRVIGSAPMVVLQDIPAALAAALLLTAVLVTVMLASLLNAKS